MPIPAAARRFTQEMDPRDLLDWEDEITQGSDPKDFLQPTEQVSSYELALTPEAAAVGLLLRQDAEYATTLTGRVLRFWLEVEPAMQSAPIFDAGVDVALEFTAWTNNTPPRRKQRTIVVRVINL